MDTALNKILGTLPADTKVYVLPLKFSQLIFSPATNIPFQTPSSDNQSPHLRHWSYSWRNVKLMALQPVDSQLPTKRNGMSSWGSMYSPFSYTRSHLPLIPSFPDHNYPLFYLDSWFHCSFLLLYSRPALVFACPSCFLYRCRLYPRTPKSQKQQVKQIP